MSLHEQPRPRCQSPDLRFCASVRVVTSGVVRLLDRDPDLAGHLDESDQARAAQAATVSTFAIPAGAWKHDGEPTWGRLILEGMLVREVHLAGQSSAELLGPGDVVMPSMTHHTDPLVPTYVTWTALEPTTIAWLGDRFAAVVHRWPVLGACLLERSERRSARLAVMQAISNLVRVDLRLHVLLWLIAERWGRVGSGGVVIPLRLTHRTLARLVGARRPTVTTAVRELASIERVVRRSDGAWLLRGGPPEILDATHDSPVPLTAMEVIDGDRVNGEVTLDGLRAAYERQVALAATLARQSERLREDYERLMTEMRPA